MTTILINTQKLLTVTQKLAKIATAKNYNLDFLELTFTQKSLFLRATNLQIEANAVLPLQKNTTKVAKIQVPPLQFLKVLQIMQSEKIELHISDNKFLIKNDKQTYFVDIKEKYDVDFKDFTEEENEVIEIDPIFWEEAQAIASYASDDFDRKNISCVHFNNEFAEIVATDGHKMVVVKCTNKPPKMNIPASVFNKIPNKIKKLELIKSEREKNFLRVHDDEVAYLIKLDEVSYPPYKKVIPENEDFFEADEDLLGAVQRVRMLEEDIYFSRNPEDLFILENEKCSENLNYSLKTDIYTLLDTRKLIHILKLFRGKYKVFYETNNSKTGIVFKNNKYTAVLMPLTIR